MEKKDIHSLLASKKEPLKTFAEADRKKGGRPKKEVGALAKDNRYTVYFTPEELSILEAGMDAYGINSVAKFIKLAALRLSKLEK
ncbi:MAG: hypothetical protein M1486_05900 [Gammaproteobacteria bacterium]|nr:hypothetical protein [Gammaproteobacteria bacterium]